MALESAHLELLAALLDKTTLAGASQVISLSPSAASRRLQDAERLVGVALTEKSGRTIRLTPAGRLLAEAATTSAKRMSEAELAARWLGSAGPQPVRVGIGFFDAVAWLLPGQDEVPYDVVRSAGQTNAVLESSTFDLAIDVISSRSTSIDSESFEILGADQLALVVSLDHPLAGRSRVGVPEVAGERYLASSTNPLPGFEFEQFFLPSGDCPEHILTIGSFSLLMDLVARGEGVTIQPSLAATNSSTPGLAVVPLDRAIPVSWVAARPNRSDQRVDRLLQLASDLFD